MASARLLWRGSLHDAASANTLHGLAIVAPSFTLPELLDDDDDDPFSSNSGSTAAAAADRAAASRHDAALFSELCLDLEMIRNRTLTIVTSRVRLLVDEDGRNGPTMAVAADASRVHGRKSVKKSIEMLRKGKSRASDQLSSLSSLSSSSSAFAPVRLHYPVNESQALTLYIDERCEATLDWFNDCFCQEPVHPCTGRTQTGVMLTLAEGHDLGLFSAASTSNIKNKLVIYGRLMCPENSANGAQSTSMSLESRPRLQLCVSRIKPDTASAPRPDDPAPRENLFAQKLRRSVSQPSIRSAPAPANVGSGKVPVPSRGSKNAASSGAVEQQNPRGLQRSKSALAAPSRARNPFARQTGSGASDTVETARKGPAAKRKALSTTTLARSSGNTNASSSPGRRGQKRPKLTASDLKRLEEEEEEDDDGDADMDKLREDGRRSDLDDGQDEDEAITLAMRRQGSPTPSVATNRSTTLKVPSQTNKLARTGLSRSASMPPGQLLAGRARSVARADSVAPSVAETDGDGDNKNDTYETRNKGSIRKVLLAEMSARKVGREHPEFKEVFAVAYRGICCSFRHLIPVARIDKIEIIICARKHLEMYIPLKLV